MHHAGPTPGKEAEGGLSSVSRGRTSIVKRGKARLILEAIQRYALESMEKSPQNPLVAARLAK